VDALLTVDIEAGGNEDAAQLRFHLTGDMHDQLEMQKEGSVLPE
jgi:hypothetical protein